MRKEMRGGVQAITALTMLGLPALADQNTKYPIDRWLESAIKKDPSTYGMRRATQQAETKWDAELNRKYQQIRNGLKPKERAALVRAQKAWIAFRDAEFEASRIIVSNREGTMWPLLYDDHRMTIVRDRVQQLKVYNDSMEEDK